MKKIVSLIALGWLLAVFAGIGYGETDEVTSNADLPSGRIISAAASETVEGTAIKSFQLDRDWIGVLTVDGTLWVKKGSAGWVKEYISDVKSFQIKDNRIGVLTVDGTFYVLDGGWYKEHINVKSFQLEGRRIGILTKDGTLWIKDGGPSMQWIPALSNVVSFQLNDVRIGVLRGDGSIWVDEGYGGWVKEFTDVTTAGQ